jgi:hypothetical protein
LRAIDRELTGTACDTITTDPPCGGIPLIAALDPREGGMMELIEAPSLWSIK